MRFRLYVRGEFLYCKGGEVLKQVVQRTCGCPVAGSDQGQVRWGSELPALGKMSLSTRGACDWVIFMVPSEPGHPVIL